MRTSDPTDAEIQLAMASQPAAAWRELFAAADVMAASAARPAATGQDMARSSPLASTYPADDPAVDAVVRLLYDLQVIVGFDWMTWDRGRYARGDGLAGAPAAQAARLATAIVRGERFCTGTIRHALSDGTFAAVLARLRLWFDQEHPGGPGPRARPGQ